MKTFAILILGAFLLLGSITSYAGLPQEKKLTRKEKKEIREGELTNQLQKTAKLINKLVFVLKADYLIDKTGYMVVVDSKINFILVDSTFSTVQIGSGVGVGDNGVGGLTADGKITNWKLKENSKQKSISISYNISTKTDRFNIVMQIEANGSTQAFFSSLTKGSSLTFKGKVVPIFGSGIFKGSAYY